MKQKHQERLSSSSSLLHVSASNANDDDGSDSLRAEFHTGFLVISFVSHLKLSSLSDRVWSLQEDGS